MLALCVGSSAAGSHWENPVPTTSHMQPAKSCSTPQVTKPPKEKLLHPVQSAARYAGRECTAVELACALEATVACLARVPPQVHLESKKLAHEAALATGANATQLAEQVHGKGRGILITAGGRDMLGNAFITIRMLRERLNCTLPIEVSRMMWSSLWIILCLCHGCSPGGRPPIHWVAFV